MGIIAFGLPNLVTDLLGIGHVTVSGIQKNRIWVKEDISPRSRRAGQRERARERRDGKQVVVEG